MMWVEVCVHARLHCELTAGWSPPVFPSCCGVGLPAWHHRLPVDSNTVVVLCQRQLYWLLYLHNAGVPQIGSVVGPMALEFLTVQSNAMEHCVSPKCMLYSIVLHCSLIGISAVLY